MKRSDARRRAIPAVLLCTLVLSACAGVGASTGAHVAHGAVVVDVIGDSLSTGADTPGDPWTRDAQQLYSVHRRNVQFVNAAENGAGYVSVGQNGDTFLDEVEQVVGPSSNVVLLFGSDNDLGQPSLTQAVATTLYRVRELAPRAQVIVVGPPAPPSQQPQQLAGVRDALQSASRQAGDRFVDPLQLRWFEGDTAGDVASDAEHPNVDGERFLAQQMAAILAPTVDRLSAA